MPQRSRFSVEYPGLFRSLWYRVRYPSSWPQKMRGSVIDRQMGGRLQLSESEEEMMSVLADRMLEFDSPWSPEWIDNAIDYGLAAIVARRRGDDQAWTRL